ncbi:hypothetical protein [Ferviditalea candida]|uniref:DUF4145 domain-containing protein n=1 Tax=Ferviditalea candida TaxID=3108399 RepID=A0ABU5ZQD0_9BACL|nr:hypothetical protein [Paenibacillaceae bacterium T2]
MLRNITLIKTLTTLLAVVLVLIHIFFPDLKVDSITLGLLVVAVLPWLAPLFKSVELPGGMKFELQDFKEIEEKADKAGMFDKDIQPTNQIEYTFQLVAKEDPKLALAGLRIELEDKLRKLAYENDLDTKYKGLGNLLKILSSHDLITFEERSVLADMVRMLNAAVHCEVDRFEYSNVSWALELGIKILNSLNKRIK